MFVIFIIIIVSKKKGGGKEGIRLKKYVNNISSSLSFPLIIYSDMTSG